MSAEKKPVVAITIGDPAGIGPEITVATMMDKSVYDECKPFLIGSVPIISRATTIATVSNGARCRNWRGKCRWTM